MDKPVDVKLPPAFTCGAFRATFATRDADLQATQRLRHICFVEGAGRDPLPGGVESDPFDALCDHVMITAADGRVLCSYRLLPIDSGAQIARSYSAQFYDLTCLEAFSAPMVELGRFCIHPDAHDPDILRIAWGMLAAYCDARRAQMLFGCSSFHGTDPAAYGAAFDLLTARHLAPVHWRAGVRSAQTVAFAADARPVTDHKRAIAQVPALLKTYLNMGGWVSDHAVIDHAMNTLHVFTALEIAAIPAPRAKALRAIAATEPPAGV